MNKNENKNENINEERIHETELEKVSGGHVPLYNDGIPYYDRKPREEKPREGGATGGW